MQIKTKNSVLKVKITSLPSVSCTLTLSILQQMKTPQPDTSHPAEHAGNTIASLRKAAANCRACHLWEHATQTVFGEGSSRTSVMLVGEQPGDREDIAGHPFVGPAGSILSHALAAVGVSREEVYVTNAVKHFKFELRGKRRMHKKPVDTGDRGQGCYLNLQY